MAVDDVDSAVGELGQFFVVRHDNERLSQFVAEFKEELVQFGLVVGVERTRRLVGENHIGLIHQRPRHGHALLLATAQFVGLVFRTVLKSHKLEEFECALTEFTMGAAGNHSRNHDVFERREFGEELVELKDESDVPVAEVGQFATVERQHVGTVDKEAASIGLVERADDLEQRGFARAAWAYDTDNFAFLDVEVDALEHLEWAEGFPDSVEFYHNGVKVNGKRRKKQEEEPLQLPREVLGPVRLVRPV